MRPIQQPRIAPPFLSTSPGSGCRLPLSMQQDKVAIWRVRRRRAGSVGLALGYYGFRLSSSTVANPNGTERRFGLSTSTSIVSSLRLNGSGCRPPHPHECAMPEFLTLHEHARVLCWIAGAAPSCTENNTVIPPSSEADCKLEVELVRL